MIHEQATVVSVDSESMLVETIQQSTCGTCSAQKGCGQGVLAKYLSSSSFFRVELNAELLDRYREGDRVELGIDELALVRASLFLYLVPLAGLILGAYLGSLHSELSSVLGALSGIFVGGYITANHARRVKDDPRYAPVLVASSDSIRIVQPMDSIEA